MKVNINNRDVNDEHENSYMSNSAMVAGPHAGNPLSQMQSIQMNIIKQQQK